jgi:hypothetical protein
MGVRWGALLFASVTTAAVLVTTAGASTDRVAIPGLGSSNAAVAKYLVSIGIEPTGIVIQRGAHNYAGPHCPGVGWACTSAMRVVQIATSSRDGGNGDGNDNNDNEDNSFECTASPGGSSTPPNLCTIVQISTGGATNVARCVEESQFAAVAQGCSIFQRNTTGDNRALIKQAVDAEGGPTQNATQYGGVDQQNGAGSNFAKVAQTIRQSTRDPGAQKQDGHQSVFVGQNADVGSNTALVGQSLGQKAKSTGEAVASQNQNTTSVGPNTNAGITQYSTLGSNTAWLNQVNLLAASASKATGGRQQQGTRGGGLNGYFSQQSAGLSIVKGLQIERQTLRAERSGPISQFQYGPMWLDPPQGTNPGDRIDLNQSSTQQASNPTLQDDQGYANCDTTGNCTVSQRIQQQGTTNTNSCSGTSCSIGLVAVSGGEGAYVTRCVGGESNTDLPPCTTSTPQPPPPPFRTD